MVVTGSKPACFSESNHVKAGVVVDGQDRVVDRLGYLKVSLINVFFDDGCEFNEVFFGHGSVYLRKWLKNRL